MHADVRAGAIACTLFALTHAFYIPGVSYKAYRDGDVLPLLVNKVYSDQSELQYAYTELPFVCPPTGRVRAGRFTSGASLSLNLGEVLRGDRITVSDYELNMGTDDEAHFLCSKTVNKEGLKRTRELIRDGYVAEWIVDNLPGATSFQTTDKTRRYYAAGFKIGEEVIASPGAPPQYFLYNHLTLVIRYRLAPGRDGEQGKKVVVGFEVFPKSVEAENRDKDGLPNKDSLAGEKKLELVAKSNTTDGADENEDASLEIPFTYSVYFRKEEKLEWKNRWDMYFVVADDSTNIHWFAIINSIVIAGLLSAVVAVILARTIQGDISDDGKIKSRSARGPHTPRRLRDKSSGLLSDLEGDVDLDDDDDDDALEDVTGWKLVHGDVFRPPPHGSLLAPLIGSGIQLLLMTATLLLLSALGILNPSFRGGYVSVGTGLFIAAGLFSGYFSSRIYATYGGTAWQQNILITASLVPGLLFATTLVLNLFVWVQASSTAIPFSTLLALLALWLFIQLPLVYVGGRHGFVRAGAYAQPIKANAVPRAIPRQSWGQRTGQAVLLSGGIPFVVMFIELMFVLKNLWMDKSGFYYVFGFLGVVVGILVVTVVEVSIVATYVLLCSENYNWPWHSFFVGASSAAWIFAYLVYYFFSKLHISGFISGMLFFSYGALACGVYGLGMGTVAFFSAWWFVGRIYGAIKVD
ncbi:hypothetical protein EJ04DRAFT_500011 [Polyplosphaeria fusca]|uniref:Transmembrane 9 superfamily member n=1 Tax=Polyplosphaeria fusca TaxID=682080 RepID=A0A9P4QTM7_9PLEO|nr:hypothetical protein EJ04DRAFT_500011 [Polyplosphaeria fusca]